MFGMRLGYLNPVPLMTTVSLLDPWLAEREYTAGVAHWENVNLGRSEVTCPAASTAQLDTMEAMSSQMMPLGSVVTLSVGEKRLCVETS